VVGDRRRAEQGRTGQDQDKGTDRVYARDSPVIAHTVATEHTLLLALITRRERETGFSLFSS
jgi:hypothetical protein